VLSIPMTPQIPHIPNHCTLNERGVPAVPERCCSKSFVYIGIICPPTQTCITTFGEENLLVRNSRLEVISRKALENSPV
jgi:hypothetical protein